MSKADVAAAILWVGATFYALFGGADFGGGFWDLIAGDAEKGERPRALIQRSLTPVWEANHVWLIFILVVLWTAFPPAFSADLHRPSTCRSPWPRWGSSCAAPASPSASRSRGCAARRAAGATFALSSVLTPFFMGAVVGAIASGNVPADGNGDAFSSWLEPLPLLTGAMFVATGAYLSAVFLVGDARRAGEADLERYFVRRALAAAAVAGVAAAVGLVELHAEARYIFDRLVDQGLPLVILSALCGLGLLAVLLRGGRRAAAAARGRRRGRRDLGLGGGPVPLPAADSLRIDQAAAPDPTLDIVFIVFARRRGPGAALAGAALHAQPARPARARAAEQRGRLHQWEAGRCTQFQLKVRWAAPPMGPDDQYSPAGPVGAIAPRPSSRSPSRRRAPSPRHAAAEEGTGPPLVARRPRSCFAKTTVGTETPGLAVDVSQRRRSGADRQGRDRRRRRRRIQAHNSALRRAQPGQHCTAWVAFSPAAPAKRSDAGRQLQGTAGRDASSRSAGPRSPRSSTSRRRATTSGSSGSTRRRLASLAAHQHRRSRRQLNSLGIGGDTSYFWTGNSNCWAALAAARPELQRRGRLQPPETRRLRRPNCGAHGQRLRASPPTLSGYGGRAIVEADVQPGPASAPHGRHRRRGADDRQ